MENMEIYKALCTPPKEALSLITGGRLKGLTDISPMWRIQALTAQFGPCGVGWKYETVEMWTEPGANGEIAAFCSIKLYIKVDGVWSDPIPGTGGSMLVSKERNGLYTDDDCYKKAQTDAISVACKALGVGGDVYMGKDPSKYNVPSGSPPDQPPVSGPVCQQCGQPVKGIKRKDGSTRTAEQVARYGEETFGRVLCMSCQRQEQEK